MASTETLAQVAELLPQPHREQFLAMIVQFKSVPKDDEYLQILNAIGFMTLLWKEVPSEIKGILEGANPVTETCHSIGKQVREAVIEAIPSYDDLKTIVRGLQEHELALKRSLSAGASKSNSNGISSALITFIIGAGCGVLFQEQIFSLIQWFISFFS